MSNLMRIGDIIGSPMIKSIQRVMIPAKESTTSGSISVTINAVIPENCIIFFGSWPPMYVNGALILNPYIANSTTLTIADYRYITPTFSMFVIEIDSSYVKSKQNGTIYQNTFGTFNVAISTVNPAKCIPTVLYAARDSSNGTQSAYISGITENQLSIYNYGRYQTIRWDILELK